MVINAAITKAPITTLASHTLTNTSLRAFMLPRPLLQPVLFQFPDEPERDVAYHVANPHLAAIALALQQLALAAMQDRTDNLVPGIVLLPYLDNLDGKPRAVLVDVCTVECDCCHCLLQYVNPAQVLSEGDVDKLLLGIQETEYAGGPINVHILSIDRANTPIV